MPIITDDVDVYPWDLLEVQYRVGRQTRTRVAFEVRYVVVELSGGRPAVAVQILYDRDEQRPFEPYVCQQYQQTLLSPKALVSIRPYYLTAG